MIRFKLIAAFLLFAGLAQLVYAQPAPAPILPIGANCVITFDNGSPSSTVAGRVDAKGRYNIAKGWTFEKIEVTLSKHAGNPPAQIGTPALTNIILPAGIANDTFWETAFVGLISGENVSVHPRIFVYRIVDGQKKTDSSSTASGIFAVK